MQSPMTDMNMLDEKVHQGISCIEVPPFARRCREHADRIWGASFEHPFVKSLIDGTLSLDRFRFYQMQDARYLEAYADACSIISTRFHEPGDKLWFIEGARLAVLVERELHSEYGKKLGYTAEDISDLELSPSNLAYQNHILTAARGASLLEALAALAPCPWLYSDIGIQIGKKLGNIAADHPFRNWLLTYSDTDFVTYTSELLVFLEKAASGHGDDSRELAVKAFQTSTRYEWMFWDQAWEMQKWPV